MLNFNMPESINTAEAGDRLRQACKAKKINNPVELMKELKALDLPTAVISTVRDHWNGSRIGQAAFWASYSIATGKSLDWFLLGKEPVAPEFNQLRSLADWLIAAIGGEEAAEAYDPVLRELVKIAKVLEPTDLGFLKSMAEKLQDRKREE